MLQNTETYAFFETYIVDRKRSLSWIQWSQSWYMKWIAGSATQITSYDILRTGIKLQQKRSEEINSKYLRRVETDSRNADLATTNGRRRRNLVDRQDRICDCACLDISIRREWQNNNIQSASRSEMRSGGGGGMKRPRGEYRKECNGLKRPCLVDRNYVWSGIPKAKVVQRYSLSHSPHAAGWFSWTDLISVHHWCHIDCVACERDERSWMESWTFIEVSSFLVASLSLIGVDKHVIFIGLDAELWVYFCNEDWGD